MPRTLIWIGSTLLITASGFAEVLITAQDYAVDSDVVLESAVQEIKSIPGDTINVVGDSVKFVKDETVTAAKGIAAVFKKDLSESAAKAGELAVENAWDFSNDILFRSYKVSDEIGTVLMTSAGGAEAGEGPSVDVSTFFSGINFPKKTSAYYLPTLKQLFVRQTMENVLAIENVLADYQSARRDLMGKQVEIEAKFVEVNQKTLNELGFSWNFGNKNGGDLHIMDNLYLPDGQDILAGGLRTASQALNAGAGSGSLLVSKTAGSLRWDMLISALEQSDGADVLSAPRVVARSGSTATIQVGEEQQIPKSFEANNQDVSPWVEHADWELQLMGVQLEVTPELREGGLIDLGVTPKIKELVGYDSYLVTQPYTGVSAVAAPVTGSLPYFRIREMDTKVTVANGSTVGMGGLIYDKLETFRDKVPVLGSIPLIGRLFRSEGNKSVKRNLMIFVTATQVDVDGRKASDLALKK